MTEELYDSEESLGPDIGDDPSRANETRQSYEESRSPITTLFEYPARQVLVEWAVDAYFHEDEQYYNKSQLHEKTGLSRQTIHEHIDVLADFGVLEKDNGGFRPNYDTGFCHTIGLLSNDLLEYYQGDYDE